MIWVHLYRFLNVGAIGFAIDAGVLWFLVYVLDVGAIPARCLSFVLTIAVTFVLNARYTFGVSVRASSKSRYIAVQLSGAAINFITYTVLVLTGPLAGRPLLSLVVGSALASTHNFLMLRRFVFNENALRERPARPRRRRNDPQRTTRNKRESSSEPLERSNSRA